MRWSTILCLAHNSFELKNKPGRKKIRVQREKTADLRARMFHRNTFPPGAPSMQVEPDVFYMMKNNTRTRTQHEDDQRVLYSSRAERKPVHTDSGYECRWQQEKLNLEQHSTAPS